MITEIKGNLFDFINSQMCIVHCISLDCEMGAGFALDLVSRVEGLKQFCIDNSDSVGQVILFRNDNYLIANLVTKLKYSDKPSYFDFHKSLVNLNELCYDEGIENLIMPMIGCNRDKLNWNRVRSVLSDTIKNSQILVVDKNLGG